MDENGKTVWREKEERRDAESTRFGPNLMSYLEELLILISFYIIVSRASEKSSACKTTSVLFRSNQPSYLS